MRVSTRRHLWRISGASIGGEEVPMCGVRSVLGQPRKSHSQLSETLPGSMSCGYTSTYAPAWRIRSSMSHGVVVQFYRFKGQSTYQMTALQRFDEVGDDDHATSARIE